VRSARTAASNTRNFGQKPNKGGTPARLNMKMAMPAASQGRVVERPDREAMLSTALPSESRILRTTRNEPKVITT
jgi:hypothetical protein